MLVAIGMPVPCVFIETCMAPVFLSMTFSISTAKRCISTSPSDCSCVVSISPRRIELATLSLFGDLAISKSRLGSRTKRNALPLSHWGVLLNGLRDFYKAFMLFPKFRRREKSIETKSRSEPGSLPGYASAGQSGFLVHAASSFAVPQVDPAIA